MTKKYRWYKSKQRKGYKYTDVHVNEICVHADSRMKYIYIYSEDNCKNKITTHQGQTQPWKLDAKKTRGEKNRKLCIDFRDFIFRQKKKQIHLLLHSYCKGLRLTWLAATKWSTTAPRRKTSAIKEGEEKERERLQETGPREWRPKYVPSDIQDGDQARFGRRWRCVCMCIVCVVVCSACLWRVEGGGKEGSR